VHDSDGNVSTLHPGRDLLPGIEIYGQNEIYELARDESARIGVLERFLPPEAKQARQLADLRKTLTDNAARLESALSNEDDLSQEIAQLPKLNEQVAQFKDLGIEEKLKQVPLLEKERQLKPRMDEEVQNVEDAAQNLEESLPDLVFLSDKALEGLPHAPLLRRGRDALESLKTAATKALADLRGAVKTARAELTTLEAELTAGGGVRQASRRRRKARLGNRTRVPSTTAGDRTDSAQRSESRHGAQIDRSLGAGAAESACRAIGSTQPAYRGVARNREKAQQAVAG
jgi:hypothetical protein